MIRNSRLLCKLIRPLHPTQSRGLLRGLSSVARLKEQRVKYTPNILLNKDNDNKDEDDEQGEEQREKKFSFKEFGQDPFNQKAFVLFIGGIVLVWYFSEECRDIVGIELGSYDEIGILKLEELMMKNEVVSIKCVKFSGDMSDVFKAVIYTSQGQKLVFSFSNPDNFVQFVQQVEAKSGHQTPLIYSVKIPILQKMETVTKIAYPLIMTVYFLLGIKSLFRIKKALSNTLTPKSSIQMIR